MVIRTPPVLSLKRGFLPQIHQPLPLSRRESRQLLESITTSFRNNLDKEHPWKQDETASHSSPPAGRHRPTDSHLRAILNNPLFSHPRDTKPAQAQPADLKNQFCIFDSAVSRGLMTPRRAAGFLATVRKQIAKESSSDVRRRMAESGAGLHVLQWLRASGQQNELHFLSDIFLIQNLVPFMYTEGLQEIIWVWLARLAARLTDLEFETRPGKVNAQSLATLLSSIVKEATEPGTEAKPSLDNSYSVLARANDLFPIRNQLAANNIQNAWEGLSWESTVNFAARPKPSATLFDSFLSIGRPFKLELDLAHLDLHHPTTPQHSTAVEYLRLKNQIEGDIADMEYTARSQRRIICLALDTADRLKQAGKSEEASWVERFLTRLYDGLNLGMFNLQKMDALLSEVPIGRST